MASTLCRGKEVEVARGAIMEEVEWPASQRGGTGCKGGGIGEVTGDGEGKGGHKKKGCSIKGEGGSYINKK